MWTSIFQTIDLYWSHALLLSMRSPNIISVTYCLLSRIKDIGYSGAARLLLRVLPFRTVGSIV